MESYKEKLNRLHEKVMKEVKKLKVGDKVKIPNNLTKDPLNKQGQKGKIIKIDGDIVHVKFNDGYVGKYMDDAVMIESLKDKLESLKENQLKVGDEVTTQAGEGKITKVRGNKVMVKLNRRADFPNQEMEYDIKQVRKI